MNQKRKLEVLLDKQIQRKLQELEYWQKQRHKLVVNRNIKKKLEMRLTKKLAKEESMSAFNASDPTSVFTTYSSAPSMSVLPTSPPSSVTSQSSCSCEKKTKKKKKKGGIQMSCFTMTKDHWKTKPYWTGISVFLYTIKRAHIYIRELINLQSVHYKSVQCNDSYFFINCTWLHKTVIIFMISLRQIFLIQNNFPLVARINFISWKKKTFIEFYEPDPIVFLIDQKPDFMSWISTFIVLRTRSNCFPYNFRTRFHSMRQYS